MVTTDRSVDENDDFRHEETDNLISSIHVAHSESREIQGSISYGPAGSQINENTSFPETLSPSPSEGTDVDAAEAETNIDGSNERQDDEESTDREEERSGTIGLLTRRLRCLFSTITWPIVPLGTIVALALLWVLYAASSLDLRRSCSHPLHWYALASLILVAYIPHHAQVRSQLFQYSRERDGPIRPARVRMYDQFFHTICLLYVYTGVTLIQTCHEDVLTADNLAELLQKLGVDSIPPDTPMNTCAATCPNLYQALSVYVASLEMFTFALILPLLFLPCIYLWFLRRATAEAEAFAQLQDRLQEEEALLSNGGVTAGEILDSLENVKLISRPPIDNAGERQVWLLPSSATDVSIGMNSDVKECCICMNEFCIQNESDGDLETGVHEDTRNIPGTNPSESSPSSTDSSTTSSVSVDIKETKIVRTRCGHVFHKECLAGWVSGRWQLNPQSNTGNEEATQDRRRRRARQTCCPLCREDLRPHSS
mmetsp:Transcript_18182/g.36612  ORF Transcript_18182/g.36612 Transcript_18182/m.36612 type:complete len:484 (+) Transcript_18182:193-1644(+)